MNETAEPELRALIESIEDPHTNRPLGQAVRGFSVRKGKAAVAIELAYPAAGWHEALRQVISQRLSAAGSIDALTVEIETKIARHAVQGGLKPIAGVRNILAVASGKGGVGKSTISANLALALHAEGACVGVLDADIYGPSQPRMLGLQGRPEATAERRILPMRAHGLQAISIGVLVGTDQAMIWRGPMATQALQQLFSETLWDDLDYLIVDLPPGTGDIQLTLAQRIPVSAALAVTTPQAVAVDDVRRAVAMFAKVRVPVLGVIENMSTHLCSRCGHEDAIFGAGGAAAIAEEAGLALLGQLPLETALGRSTDDGRPIVVADPEHPMARRFGEIARRVAARLSLQARESSVAIPKIRIVD